MSRAVHPGRGPETWTPFLALPAGTGRSCGGPRRFWDSDRSLPGVEGEELYSSADDAGGVLEAGLSLGLGVLLGLWAIRAELR
jgi:hypothetical protein